MESMTKQEYLDSLLRDLKSRATRFKRASDDQDLLLMDLEYIECKIDRIQEVKASSKEFYSWHDIETYKLSLMKRDIDEIANDKSS